MKVNERRCLVPIDVCRGDVHFGGSVHAFLSWTAPPLASAWACASKTRPAKCCTSTAFTCIQSPLRAPNPGRHFSVLLSTKHTLENASQQSAWTWKRKSMALNETASLPSRFRHVTPCHGASPLDDSYRIVTLVPAGSRVML